jgi:hypothetical protein
VIARTQDQIDEQINRAVESRDEHGTQWPGMSYEDGVDAALRWVTGESDDAPMDDE